MIRVVIADDQGPVPKGLALILDGRERETLHMLAHGSSNAETAAALLFSEATVKTHVTRQQCPPSR